MPILHLQIFMFFDFSLLIFHLYHSFCLLTFNLEEVEHGRWKKLVVIVASTIIATISGMFLVLCCYIHKVRKKMTGTCWLLSRNFHEKRFWAKKRFLFSLSHVNLTSLISIITLLTKIKPFSFVREIAKFQRTWRWVGYPISWPVNIIFGHK